MANLDDIDKRLLSELQAEGRVTNVELAQRVGLTAPPCLRRVRGLEEDGVIRGYHADLDPSKLGFAITVFAMVSLKSQAESSLREFEEHMRGLPEVRECHNITGNVEYLLRVECADMASYKEFHTERLGALPHVRQITSHIVMGSPKDTRA